MIKCLWALASWCRWPRSTGLMPTSSRSIISAGMPDSFSTCASDKCALMGMAYLCCIRRLLGTARQNKGRRFARTHKSARARRHDVFRAGLHIQRRLLRGSLSPGQQIEIHAGPAGAHPRAGQPPWKTGDRGTHQPPGLPLFRLCGAGVPCSRHPARPAVRLCRSCAVFTAEQNAGVPVATGAPALRIFH